MHIGCRGDSFFFWRVSDIGVNVFFVQEEMLCLYESLSIKLNGWLASFLSWSWPWRQMLKRFASLFYVVMVVVAYYLWFTNDFRAFIRSLGVTSFRRYMIGCGFWALNMCYLPQWIRIGLTAAWLAHHLKLDIRIDWIITCKGSQAFKTLCFLWMIKNTTWKLLNDLISLFSGFFVIINGFIVFGSEITVHYHLFNFFLLTCKHLLELRDCLVEFRFLEHIFLFKLSDGVLGLGKLTIQACYLRSKCIQLTILRINQYVYSLN